MYISNNNHFTNIQHVQVEAPLIENNCQQMTNLVIIQPQYSHYDYTTSNSNDYSQSVQQPSGGHLTSTDFNATLPIMDVDSFVANLSNLEEVQYCIDSSAHSNHPQSQSNHLSLPTQLIQHTDNLNQNSTNVNAQILQQNKLNYEDYSLVNLDSTNLNMTHQNYMPDVNNLDSKLNDKMSKVDILNQVIMSATNISSCKANSEYSNGNGLNYDNYHNQLNVVKSTKKVFNSKIKLKQKGANLFIFYLREKNFNADQKK